MNVAAIIQARNGSTRLPNKTFLKLSGRSLLYHVVNRLKPSVEIDKIIIATTKNNNDKSIEKWCIENNIEVYRGDENNVLKRYYKASIKHNVDIIVRVTADDPFKDFNLIDTAIRILKKNELDFVCNNFPVSFPEGLDVEVFSFKTLEISYKNAESDFEKEHVTQYVHKNKEKFKIFNILNERDLSYHRWTIDTIYDYRFAQMIYNKLFSENKIFQQDEIYKLLTNNPEIFKINSSVKKSNLYIKKLN